MTNSTNSEAEAMPMEIRESDDTDFGLIRSRSLIWKTPANTTDLDVDPARTILSSAKKNEGQLSWEKARPERAKHRRQMLEKIRAALKGETSDAIKPDEEIVVESDD